MDATIIQTEMFKSRVIYLIPYSIEKPSKFYVMLSGVDICVAVQLVLHT